MNCTTPIRVSSWRAVSATARDGRSPGGRPPLGRARRGRRPGPPAELIREVTRGARDMGLANDLFDDAASRRLGVNRTDTRVMDILERDGPLTPSRLAELSRLSRPAMTTVIDRLEKAGYARRQADRDDRRRVLVEMTPLARRRAMEIYGPFGELTAEEFQRYSSAELEAIIRFMRHAVDMSTRQLGRITPRDAG